MQIRSIGAECVNRRTHKTAGKCPATEGPSENSRLETQPSRNKNKTLTVTKATRLRVRKKTPEKKNMKISKKQYEKNDTHDSAKSGPWTRLKNTDNGNFTCK